MHRIFQDFIHCTLKKALTKSLKDPYRVSEESVKDIFKISLDKDPFKILVRSLKILKDPVRFFTREGYHCIFGMLNPDTAQPCSSLLSQYFCCLAQLHQSPPTEAYLLK